ncbi:MAG: NAD(P)-binding domain-containing protein, partial [Acidobacteriota bacterium]
MNFGVLGTGMVGKALAGKLSSLGHEVMMGTRSADTPEIQAWAQQKSIRLGTFAAAAAFGETLISCTAGATSIEVLRSVNPRDLAGKVLIDVSNPLDFSKGMPATLSICNTDSLGETLQREFPALRVVKALNTCNCQVMVDP